MMTKLKIGILIILVIFVLLFYGIQDANQYRVQNAESWADMMWNLSYIAPPNSALQDNSAVYPNDEEDLAIENLYLDVLPTTLTNGRIITLSELNQIDNRDQTLPELNARISTSKTIATSDEMPNATVTLRGQSTIQAEIKSYKIKILSSEDAWHGQFNLNLNKHVFDDTRIRNKVAFDLLEKIPNFSSLRTQFVHLYIRDYSQTFNQSADYDDYGYFTHIEKVDREFLKAHGFDPAGTVYKAREFEYLRYPEELINVDDPNYDQNKFDSRIQLITGNGHTKLLKMLDDLNNEELDFDKVFALHFNKDNFLTWMAVNILLGNYDTMTQNFFLYSPRNTSTWYLMPWDYDGSMLWEQSTGAIESQDQLHVGVANYWNTTLAKRYFSTPEHVNDLDQKIEEVYAIFSEAGMKQTVEKYSEFAKLNCLTDPYYFELFKNSDALDAGLAAVQASVGHNYALYQNSKEKPMPFFQGVPEKTGDGLNFYWDPSFDLQADRISYTLQISSDPEFSNIIYEKRRLIETEWTILTKDLPMTGEYFWRVKAIDSNGYTQRSFDRYTDETGQVFYGLMTLKIDERG